MTVAPRTLFAYGTLKEPTRVKSLLGRIPPTTKARLRHYERTSFSGLPYYVAIPRTGSVIEGVVLHDLSADDFAILDEYEDVSRGLYERVVVVVQSEGDGEAVPAQVYRAGPSVEV